MNIEAIEDIVGFNRFGDKFPTSTSRNLRARAKQWAKHVLEIPTVWIM